MSFKAWHNRDITGVSKLNFHKTLQPKPPSSATALYTLLPNSQPLARNPFIEPTTFMEYSKGHTPTLGKGTKLGPRDIIMDETL